MLQNIPEVLETSSAQCFSVFINILDTSTPHLDTPAPPAFAGDTDQSDQSDQSDDSDISDTVSPHSGHPRASFWTPATPPAFAGDTD